MEYSFPNKPESQPGPLFEADLRQTEWMLVRLHIPPRNSEGAPPSNATQLMISDFLIVHHQQREKLLTISS
jgi:hypothetical protein